MTLSFLLRCHIENNNFEQAENLVVALQALQSEKGFNTIDMLVRTFANSTNLAFLMNHKQGNFHQCIEDIPTIEKQQLDLGDKISKEQEILLTYNKAYSYFGIGEYRKALSYLNLVLNDNEQNLRKDIYSYARLFNLIIHYELGNEDFLEYLIKSTSRYLQKQDRAFEVEKVCIQFIRKLPKSADAADRLILFEKMKDALDALLDQPEHRVILEYFHLGAWITSKIYKISFSDAVRNELEKSMSEDMA
jgi:tetratricopeptide (TPR) repeat protein